MNFARIKLVVVSWLAVGLALAQDPASTPCLDNPIQWERRAGEPTSPGAAVIVSAEGMRNLGVTSVAEMLEQMPREPAAVPQCSSPIERNIGGLGWHVSECRGTEDLTILRFEPHPPSESPYFITLSLMRGMCSVRTPATLTDDFQRARAALQQLTREEIDQLVADVREDE